MINEEVKLELDNALPSISRLTPFQIEVSKMRALLKSNEEKKQQEKNMKILEEQKELKLIEFRENMKKIQLEEEKTKKYYSLNKFSRKIPEYQNTYFKGDFLTANDIIKPVSKAKLSNVAISRGVPLSSLIPPSNNSSSITNLDENNSTTTSLNNNMITKKSNKEKEKENKCAWCPHGEGCLYVNGVARLEGSFENGVFICGIVRFTDGSEWHGGVKKDLIHGHGVYYPPIAPSISPVASNSSSFEFNSTSSSPIKRELDSCSTFSPISISCSEVSFLNSANNSPQNSPITSPNRSNLKEKKFVPEGVKAIALNGEIVCLLRDLHEGLQVEFQGAFCREVVSTLSNLRAILLKQIRGWKWMVRFHDEITPRDRIINLATVGKFKVLRDLPYIYDLVSFGIDREVVKTTPSTSMIRSQWAQGFKHTSNLEDELGKVTGKKTNIFASEVLGMQLALEDNEKQEKEQRRKEQWHRLVESQKRHLLEEKRLLVKKEEQKLLRQSTSSFIPLSRSDSSG